MSVYGSKFKELLLFIKTDHNEWERKMSGKNSNPSKYNDFVDKMHNYANNDLKKLNRDDSSIVIQQIDQIEK